jgi:hypothetical protein
MNDINYLNRIKEIETRIDSFTASVKDDLNTLLDSMKKQEDKRDPLLDIPPGKEFYHIADSGSWYIGTYTPSAVANRNRFKYGNYFDTQEEAQDTSTRVGAYIRLTKARNVFYHSFDWDTDCNCCIEVSESSKNSAIVIVDCKRNKFRSIFNFKNHMDAVKFFESNKEDLHIFFGIGYWV